MDIVGIIYGEKSGIVRRIVAPSGGESELAQHVGEGEAIIIVNKDDILFGEYPDPDAYTAFVVQKLGRNIYSDRCTVINDETGEVISVIQADPRLDTVDGATLIQHDEAVPGWVMGAYDLEAPPA